MDSNEVCVAAGDAGDAGAQDSNAMQAPPMSIRPEVDEQADNKPNVLIREAGALAELGLQALYINPPLVLELQDEVLPPIPPIIVPRGQIDREFHNTCHMLDMVELGPINAPARDMPIIEEPQDEASAEWFRVATPVERRGLAAPVERRRLAALVQSPDPREDMYNYPIDEEQSSYGSVTSSTETSHTDTSDEDNLPRRPFFCPGPGNRPSEPMVYVTSRYPSGVEPVEPSAHREGLPEPSKPILIPPPTRLRPRDDEDSSSPEMAPTRSKRRRPNRSH